MKDKPIKKKFSDSSRYVPTKSDNYIKTGELLLP